MLISEGLVGPKPIPTGGGDGEQVNIPAHSIRSDGGTERCIHSILLDWCWSAEGDS
jgi:hypothetical protein